MCRKTMSPATVDHMRADRNQKRASAAPNDTIPQPPRFFLSSGVERDTRPQGASEQK
jgi:hypothetical protein